MLAMPRGKIGDVPANFGVHFMVAFCSCKFSRFQSLETFYNTFLQRNLPACVQFALRPFFLLWVNFALSFFRKSIGTLRTSPPTASDTFSIVFSFHTESCSFLWRPRHFKAREISAKRSVFKVRPADERANVRTFQLLDI